jgi:hypothetical protein
MQLFHYSPLAHLPKILSEGLSKGDIAVPWRNVWQVAVSLTTQSDPDRTAFWIEPYPFKMAVRYVCEIPSDDPKLEATRETWKRLKVPNNWIRVYDSRGQAKWWYFYHGIIPPELFVVELRSQSGYVRPTPEERANVCMAIEAERQKHTFEADPAQPNLVYMVPTEPGYHSRLLHEEGFPADLFGIVGRSAVAEGAA